MDALPDVFIATLVRDKERVAHVQNVLIPSLQAAEFPRIHVHEAVDGKSPALKDTLQREAMTLDEKYASKCKVGQLGCYMTHYLIWKRALAAGLDGCIVLEDDAVFLTDQQHVRDVLRESAAHDWVYLYTSNAQHKNDVHVQLEGCTWINKAYRQYGTVAYYVTRKAMQVLVSEMQRINGPIDLCMIQMVRYKLKAASCKTVAFGTAGQVDGRYKNEQFRSNVHSNKRALLQAKIPIVQNVEREMTKKVAFLFLTIAAPYHEEVWKMYFAGNEERFSLYVHTKNAIPNTSFFAPYVIDEHVHTTWANVMQAQMALLRAAMKDTSNFKFVFISESTLPLAVFSDAHRYLTSYEQSEFGYSHRPEMKHRIQSRHREFSQVVPALYQNPTWLVLNREHTRRMIDDKEVLPLFSDFFIDCEHYPSTVLSKYGLLESVINKDLTLCVWKEGGAHPHEFQNVAADEFVTDLYDAMRSGSLFARKFSKTCDLTWFRLHMPSLY